jgi:hypothetical protein
MEATQEPALDWKAERTGRFTSSEVARLLVGGKRPMTTEELAEEKAKGGRKTTTETIFGDGAITYIKEIMHEVITGVPKFTPITYAMQRGLELEPNAIYALSEYLGEDVTHFGAYNPKFIRLNEFSGGSPDGETKKAVVEIKCPDANFIDYLSIARGISFADEAPFSGTHNEWLKDYEPKYYYQSQMNMLLTKKKLCYFAAFDDRPLAAYKCNLAVLKIYQDKEAQELIVDRIERATQILIRQLEIFGI